MFFKNKRKKEVDQLDHYRSGNGTIPNAQKQNKFINWGLLRSKLNNLAKVVQLIVVFVGIGFVTRIFFTPTNSNFLVKEKSIEFRIVVRHRFIKHVHETEWIESSHVHRFNETSRSKSFGKSTRTVYSYDYVSWENQDYLATYGCIGNCVDAMDRINREYVYMRTRHINCSSDTEQTRMRMIRSPHERTELSLDSCVEISRNYRVMFAAESNPMAQFVVNPISQTDFLRYSMNSSWSVTFRLIDFKIYRMTINGS